MHTVVARTSTDYLLDALTANMRAFWSPYGRAEGSALHTTPQLVWFYTGIPIPLLNGVLFAHLDGPASVRAAVDALQAEIDRHGAPALWWLGPDARPQDLDAQLERRGLEPVGETPGMAVELASLAPAQPVAGLAVERVGSREEQALWARTAALGTGFPEAAAEDMARIEATLDDPQYVAQRRYIGYLDGTAVATSALVLEPGVAGIYAVATLPQARRRGIGTWMTALPLLEARDLGYRVGVLQSSAMGHPIYRKLGFADVCTYRQYLQRPSSASAH
jgi:GNAT superfamily N-acetyltransferase